MQKGKLMFGTALAAGLCGAAITGVETTVDPRTASYLTGTTTVTVDAPAEVALTVASDAAFTKVTHTADQTADAAGALAFPLAGLCPGSTYYVRAVATDGEGAAVTNDSSFTVANGGRRCATSRTRGRKSIPGWMEPNGSVRLVRPRALDMRRLLGTTCCSIRRRTMCWRRTRR